MKIQADFADGKLNGYVVINNPKKNYKFEGFITNDKKDGDCETEVKIDNKTYLIKGYYEEGKKNGTFTIEEIEPNTKNLYIKGKYKMGLRNGYFDIIDKEKGININHSYISFLHAFLLLVLFYNSNFPLPYKSSRNHTILPIGAASSRGRYLKFSSDNAENFLCTAASETERERPADAVSV